MVTVDWSPVFLSIRTAALASAITFFVGLGAARIVVGLKNDLLRTVLDGILTLPLVLPPTVAGFFLLWIFGVQQPFGKFLLDFMGVRIVFTWSATVIASFLISFPLMYRSSRGALEQVDVDMADAARTLGLGESFIFWKIQLPLAAPGILSGAILAFARGLGEFGATAMLAGNIAKKTRTLPLAVYSEVAASDFKKAGVYVAILVVVSFLTVIALNSIAVSSKRSKGAL